MKKKQTKNVKPLYNIHGERTKLTVSAHEAAHAVMRYHFNLELTDISISSMAGWLDDTRVYAGRCYGGNEPSIYTTAMLHVFAAGYAWEWRNTLDLWERYVKVLNDEPLLDYEVNDCQRIDEIIMQAFEKGESEYSPNNYKIAVEGIFSKSWDILREHYLDVINAITEKLAKHEKLSGAEVNDIIAGIALESGDAA